MLQILRVNIFVFFHFFSQILEDLEKIKLYLNNNKKIIKVIIIIIKINIKQCMCVCVCVYRSENDISVSIDKKSVLRVDMSSPPTSSPPAIS